MVQDAEVHKEDDKKFHELVTAKNTAENMINATTKSMEEMGDKIEAGEKSSIESAIKDLEEAVKGSDKDDIEAKTKALTDASAKMAERMYAQGGDAAGAADAGAQAQDASDSAADDDVVDAEFEEVDDEKKS